MPRTAAMHDRIPLNILFGLPDDRKAAIIVEAEGKRISYDLVGSVGILPHLSAARFDNFVTYLEPGRKRPLELGPGALLNHIAEPDLCPATLAQALQIAESVGRPCFNHPRAVMR